MKKLMVNNGIPEESHYEEFQHPNMNSSMMSNMNAKPKKLSKCAHLMQIFDAQFVKPTLIYKHDSPKKQNPHMPIYELHLSN